VPAHAPPAASFSWFPTSPHTGETVSLLSSSTDATSPITGFAWNLAGNGVFAALGQATSTSFSTPGSHLVQLRVTDANGLSSVASEAIAVSAPVPELMQPFPIVQISATRGSSGVKLKLLSVQAPAGARITVACTGHGCPAKSQSRVAAAGKVGAAPLAFRRFERSLRAGVILEIRVSKPGEIGKYTRYAVRRGRLPLRVDTCLAPTGVKPMACPSS
jgi:PKD repeat protein